MPTHPLQLSHPPWNASVPAGWHRGGTMSMLLVQHCRQHQSGSCSADAGGAAWCPHVGTKCFASTQHCIDANRCSGLRPQIPSRQSQLDLTNYSQQWNTVHSQVMSLSNSQQSGSVWSRTIEFSESWKWHDQASVTHPVYTHFILSFCHLWSNKEPWFKTCFSQLFYFLWYSRP